MKCHLVADIAQHALEIVLRQRLRLELLLSIDLQTGPTNSDERGNGQGEREWGQHETIDARKGTKHSARHLEGLIGQVTLQTAANLEDFRVFELRLDLGLLLHPRHRCTTSHTKHGFASQPSMEPELGSR